MAKEEELDNLNKRERKQYLKQLRTNQETKAARTRLLIGGLVVAAIVLIGAGLYFLAESRGVENIPPVGEEVAIMDPPNDRIHISPGQEHVPYSTNPPTSGPHYNQPGLGPIECKVYEEEVADESAVHNLEHGAVWVTYQDKSDTELADKLKKIVEDYSKTLLSPREKNDSKIAAVAWGRILKLDEFDEKKIRDFIRLYRNSDKAPEPLAPCGTM